MSKANILLVQNAQTQGNSTKRHLEGAGYTVVWTGSGASALAAAKQRPMDAIVIDVALPDIEGSDLCHRFRARDATRDVPIILLASQGYDLPASNGKNGRPDAVLVKPYRENDLDDRITTVIEARQAARFSREAAAVGPVLEPIAAPPQDEVIDASTGLFGRRQFDAMFSKEFKRSMRFKQQMSCMLIDLDGRKIGRAGDKATLLAIIGLVQRTIREVDTAAWWSGSELIVLLPNTIRHDAVQAAARILETVANHPFTWADATKVTMSIGVAGLPDRKIDSEQKLIDAAAAACRRAKDLMLPLQNDGVQEERS